jgi:DNA-binding IclR family transcriptional regulator
MPEVRALTRGLRVMLLVLDAGAPMTLADIARQTGIAKPTATRLLGTLIESGVVAMDASGAYVAGGEALRRFQGALISASFRERAKAALIRLRDESGETAALHLPIWPDRICVEQVESLSGLRRIHSQRECWPLTVGATGRVFLAFASEKCVKTTLSARPLHAYTPHSYVKTGEFLTELRKVREAGFAISNGSETIVGMAGAAAAIVSDGAVKMMINISGPTDRLSAKTLSGFGLLLQREAHLLSMSVDV